MKKTWAISIVFILVLVVGGGYYWNWQTLHHTVVISQPTVALSSENENKDDTVPISKGWVNMLVLGTDNRGNEIARTDSIMLVSANFDTHRVAVISIPRDTRVNIDGVGLTKITHANAVGEAKSGVHEGTLESAKAVSSLLDVAINYYVKINFQNFQKVVDCIGGLNVNLPNSVNDDLQNIHLSAGEHNLSGDEALRFARARYGLPNGDFDRQQDQFYLLSALAHQMLNLSNVSKLPSELNVIQQDLIDTNLSNSEMLAMGLAFKGIEKETIKYFQLPGKGITAYDPLVGANVYYYEPDMKGVREVVQAALIDN